MGEIANTPDTPTNNEGMPWRHNDAVFTTSATLEIHQVSDGISKQANAYT